MIGTIGPHEGRELRLMKKGIKPLSMFIEFIPSEKSLFPEKKFDEMVIRKELIKHIEYEETEGVSGERMKLRRILYALPAEEWRIKSVLLVHDIYKGLLPGWRPDLDRVIGMLLGYSSADIECFAHKHE